MPFSSRLSMATTTPIYPKKSWLGRPILIAWQTCYNKNINNSHEIIHLHSLGISMALWHNNDTISQHTITQGITSPILPHYIYVAPWCSGYHYCTTSFNSAWTQVLRRFKPCSRRVGDSRWWGSLNVFRQSTIPRKQFIIIIIIIPQQHSIRICINALPDLYIHSFFHLSFFCLTTHFCFGWGHFHPPYLLQPPLLYTQTNLNQADS